jgi:hypothetical protein
MTTLISSNKYGELYKLKKPYLLHINKTSTPFGIQQSYLKKIIHWYIKSMDDIKLVRHFQEDLLNNVLQNNTYIINTKITQKNNYPPIIETIVNPHIDSNDCISHETGEIITYNSIIKGTNAHISLKCDTISITNNTVNMMWYIEKIVRYHN